jgi:polysaccharide export outer membrane protein
VLLTPGYAVATDYRLQAGDVVEVSVAGAPELGSKVPVQLDGSLTFPIVGTVGAEGSTLTDIRARIQSAVASRVFHRRLPDGREQALTVERGEVAVSIVEYKPIFVTGQVARPGEQVFRPRMTVRQAVASAGGPLTMAASPMGVSPLAAPDLRSEYMTTWLSLAAQEARVWRLRTELGEKVELDPKAIPPAPVSENVLSNIVDVEVDLRATRQADHERQLEYLKASIAQADEQIGVLSEQRQKEEEGVDADLDELKRATELLKKGNVTNTRVIDARRAVLLSSTRMLQTGAQLMAVRKGRADFARDLEKLDDQRRIALLDELQEARLKLAGERAKLQGAQEKLDLAGMPVQALGGAAGKPILIVHRKGEHGPESLPVDYQDELQPGDVVEFSFGSDQIEVVGRVSGSGRSQ